MIPAWMPGWAWIPLSQAHPDTAYAEPLPLDPARVPPNGPPRTPTTFAGAVTGGIWKNSFRIFTAKAGRSPLPGIRAGMPLSVANNAQRRLR
jgi:hypothetical protein